MIDAERDPNAPYWPGDFQVGDRVRVRLSPECPCSHAPVSSHGATRWAAGVSGTTGTVDQLGDDGYSSADCWPEEVNATHLISVVFDNGHPRGFYGGLFAATELERLAPDA